MWTCLLLLVERVTYYYDRPQGCLVLPSAHEVSHVKLPNSVAHVGKSGIKWGLLTHRDKAMTAQHTEGKKWRPPKNVLDVAQLSVTCIAGNCLELHGHYHLKSRDQYLMAAASCKPPILSKTSFL